MQEDLGLTAVVERRIDLNRMAQLPVVRVTDRGRNDVERIGRCVAVRIRDRVRIGGGELDRPQQERPDDDAEQCTLHDLLLQVAQFDSRYLLPGGVERHFVEKIPPLRVTSSSTVARNTYLRPLP